MSKSNPVKFTIGSGKRSELNLIDDQEKNLIVCTDSALKRFNADLRLKPFFSRDSNSFEHGFKSNPSLSDIKEITQKHVNKNFDNIVGIGGGSSLDVAKIISVTLDAKKKGIEVDDILNNQELFKNLKSINCICVPTTAGTGSEATPFATIWDYENNIKLSLSSDMMFPSKAIIDPDFLKDIPYSIALSTSLDALNQAFESIWNKKSSEASEKYALQSAKDGLLACKNLIINKNDAHNHLKLCNASFFAGLAISSTRTSICHSISYPLTLNFGLPHGYACAFTMYEVFKFNQNLIRSQIDVLEKELSEDVKSNLNFILNPEHLSSIYQKYIPSKESVMLMIDEMNTKGRFDTNIKDCSKDDLLGILERSCSRYL